MVNPETARTAVGIIGNVISVGLFMSPVPTFLRIIKKKDVENFKPDPYIATILNCFLWVFYGMPFVHPHSMLVQTINGFGIFIEAIYISIFFIYSNWPKRRKILLWLLGEAVMFVAIVLSTLLAVHGTKKRTIIAGTFCVILNVIMYASPLTVMRMVIKTKSVKYMPFWLSVANLANGLTWMCYALIRIDPWVAVPNGLGAFFGILQLILYGVYYKTTNWDEEEKPKEVEIPGKP
ncbi:hypothetical protein Droror1_Dr00012353 [Drosera rotundifolia]